MQNACMVKIGVPFLPFLRQCIQCLAILRYTFWLIDIRIEKERKREMRAGACASKLSYE